MEWTGSFKLVGDEAGETLAAVPMGSVFGMDDVMRKP